MDSFINLCKKPKYLLQNVALASFLKRRKSRVVRRTEMERLGFAMTVPWKGIIEGIPSSHAHRNGNRN